jgi:CRISPR-associated protein Csm5
MKGRGQPPDQAAEAKTWWLAAGDKDQRSALLPFGWVLVEVTAINADLPEWPELQALCQPRQAAAQVFAEREQARRLDYQKRQVQRQAEVQAIRLQGEAQAAREAAEAARLARLSNNQKTLETELLAKISPANQGRGPGDQLYSALRETLRVGADWDLADRQALQTVAVKIFEHLGIARDNKKRKEMLRGLGLTG